MSHSFQYSGTHRSCRAFPDNAALPLQRHTLQPGRLLAGTATRPAAGRRKLVLVFCHIVLLSVSLALPQAIAGTHPAARFLPILSRETVEIMQKNGLPAAVDQADQWCRITGIPGSYTITFYQADQVPQQVVHEVVKLCLDLYEKHNRKERFRILMYRETREQWRKSLLLGVGSLSSMQPFFDLKIVSEK